MDATASQITSLAIVYSIIYSDADQRKHQSSASLAFVQGNHRGPVNSPHKWPVTRKMFPFDDVIMKTHGKYGIYTMTQARDCGHALKLMNETMQRRIRLTNKAKQEIRIGISHIVIYFLWGAITRPWQKLWREWVVTSHALYWCNHLSMSWAKY